MVAGSRIWHYNYRDTKPDWRHFWFPWRGGDEYGRRTWVIPVHPFGWVVWAYKTCCCTDCNKVRIQTKLWEAREAKIKRLNEVYGCTNPETCPWHKDQLDLHRGDI